MSEAKREWIRRALVRKWRGMPHRDQRIRLDAEALSCRSIEPLVNKARMSPFSVHPLTRRRLPTHDDGLTLLPPFETVKIALPVSVLPEAVATPLRTVI